jgi:hypothetical protein
MFISGNEKIDYATNLGDDAEYSRKKRCVKLNGGY